MGETGGSERCWDHEDCPVEGCDGELQQQDKFNVMCLSCEGVWSHVKTDTKHYLQTADFETVAEKSVAMTDGGTDREKIVGHILPSVDGEKQCEAWLRLFGKFEGVEFEEVEWDEYGKTAYQILSVDTETDA